MFFYHQLWLFSYHFSYCQPPWPCADCCIIPLRLPSLIILNPWTCTCCSNQTLKYLLDHTLVIASPLLVAYAELEMPMPSLLVLWLLSLLNLLHLLHLLLHMLTYLWWYLCCSSRCNTIWIWSPKIVHHGIIHFSGIIFVCVSIFFFAKVLKSWTW